jgi:hypothetical protein
MEFDVKRIRSKPADAVQFDFDHIEEIVHWTGATNYVVTSNNHENQIILQAPTWTLHLVEGDWIIKAGELEVYKAADGPFRDTFDILEDQPVTREEEIALFDMLNSIHINIEQAPKEDAVFDELTLDEIGVVKEEDE